MRPEIEDAISLTVAAADRLRQRRERMRDALVRGDEKEALRVARQIVGLDDPEGDRAGARLDGSAGRT